MTWEWQAWRCFDNIREAFEERGWDYKLPGLDATEAVPLLAESGDLRILFFERDPFTSECWFEVRDGDTPGRVVFVRGEESIPTPEGAAYLLAEYGAPLGEMRSPRELPLHGLPVAPATSVAAKGP